MKILLSILFAICCFFTNSYSQNLCIISISPNDTSVCIGQPVEVVVQANLIDSNQSSNFNSNSIPSGWFVEGGYSFASSCGLSPSGSNYYWSSTAGAIEPQIRTAVYDVTCGGVISFEMLYAEQAGPAPCEGPDQLNEGVALQYSIDGGTNWTTIEYYIPDGTITNTILTSSLTVVSGPTPFTSWNSFSVEIPPLALTTSTQFRWFQPVSSGSGFDNWGLDNILINASGAPCSPQTVFQWSNGIGNQDTALIVPITDTTFTIQVYDTSGNFQCESTPFTINVFDQGLTMQNMQNICSGSSYSIGTNVYNTSGSYIDTLISLLTGCDSLVNTQLTVISLDTTVTLLNDTLFSNQLGVNYSWINCATNQEISTLNYILPQINESYKLILSDTICSIQKSCFTVVGLGVEQNSDNVFLISPNPTNDFFIVQYSDNGPLKYSINSFSGAVIVEGIIQDKYTKIDVSNLSVGSYIIKFSNNGIENTRIFTKI